MKILNLQASNIKKLIAVDITPEGNLIKISGNNGAGKTSVLDCIMWAVCGAKNIQDKPIRDGENKAHIRLDLGRYIVERKFTEAKSYLSVYSEDGAKFGNAQEIIDKLLGAITFDPLEFANMPTKKQYESIRVLSGVTYDFEKAEQLNKTDYDNRTFVNREVKELEAQIKEIVIDEKAPDEEVNTSEVLKEIEDAREKVSAINVAKGTQDAAIKDADFLQSEISTLEAKLQELKDKQTKAEEHKKNSIQNYLNLSADLEAHNKEIETLTTKLNEASATNIAATTKRIQKVNLQKKTETLEVKKKESAALTESIDKRVEDGQKAMEAAKLPIAGLSLSAGEVFYNGIPFAQASGAEQLRVSTAIAMASNPELRVIRIKEGALLDNNGMKIIEDMAIKNDFQIWIERVGEEPLSIIIEDGQVKADNQPKQGALL
jgi:DNA repair exonuclease SbcCD ATPase subunit